MTSTLQESRATAPGTARQCGSQSAAAACNKFSIIDQQGSFGTADGSPHPHLGPGSGFEPPLLLFTLFNLDYGFREGPVFANILLADEINRATPKTQSAMLEAMEERQVTVDGKSRPLPAPTSGCMWWRAMAVCSTTRSV